WSADVQDASGRVQTTEADAYGLVTARYEPSIPSPTKYSYDVLSNLVKIEDSSRQITTVAFDSLRRKIALHDPNIGDWSYADDDNNVVLSTDGRGVQIGYRYDELNRILEKRLLADPGGVTGQPVGTVLASYGYDQGAYAIGKLTSVQDPSGITIFAYDQLGHV